MKNMLLIICVFIGNSALAQVIQSEITQIKTTSPTGLIAGAQTARATIDIRRRLIVLDFYDQKKWVTTFETPLHSTHESVCSTVIYQGIADIDLAQVEIVISDNKRFHDHCISMFPVPTTGVVLKVTMTIPFRGEFLYRMDGTELKSE